ncbi:MAG TPA: carboxypeptidase-like regulatory domain-containing protein [Bryobacteraceae bacterium]|nr:carboxypeptidase-like regulatory domain-containing protein [Bryobacteraceae bacterium]
MSKLRILVLALLPLVLTTAAYSQSIYATINGTVTDPSGAVIPDAKITVTRLETNIVSTTTSNSAGNYILPPLLEGTYNLKAGAAGFTDFALERIVLVNRDSRRIDIALQVGTAATTVEVTAGGATLMETESAKVSATLNQTAINAVPMNARWVWAYLQLMPQMNNGGGDGWRIGGGTGNETSFTIDGTTMGDGQGWAIGPQLNYMGAVSEIKVDTTNNSAEFGGVGQVSVVTASGGNAFHGHVFDTYTNTVLEARNSFAASRPSPFAWHIWGFAAGGPVYLPKIYNGKNKTFFYMSFERSWGSDSVTTLNAAVPLPAWRTGDFSNLPSGQLIYDPATKLPFPGNKIPSTRLNKVSQLIQERFYPQPNIGDNNVLGGTNHQVNFKRPWNSPWLGSIKIDHHFSDKDYVFGRFQPTGARYTQFQSNLPTLGLSPRIRTSRTATIAYTHVFNSSMFNEARWGLSFNNGPGMGAVSGQEELQRLGLVGLAPNLPDVPGMLNINWSGVGLQSLSQWNGAKMSFRNHNEDFQDHLSWYRGRHNIRMGVEVIRAEGDDFQISQKLFGAATFSSRFTSGGLDGHGHPYADFMLGIPSESGRDWPSLPMAANHWAYAGYFTDTFRVTPRLTLTYGLRYEFKQPWRENNGRLAAFDIKSGAIAVADKGMSQVSPVFPKSYVDVIPASQAGLPADTLIRADRNDFGPRLALAYNLTKNTVLRSGFGIMYENVPAINSDYVAGIGSPFLLSEPWATNPVSNPWMFPRVFPERPADTITEANIPAAINPNIRTPRSHQYSLTVEHQRWDTGFRLTYSGIGQRYGTYAYNYNAPVADGRLYIEKPRPFPKYGTINYRTDGGGHQYNALAFEVKRPMAKGLQAVFNYTLATDRGDVNRWGYIENPFSRAGDVGRVYEIPTHRITSNFIYDVPVGRGRSLGANMPRIANLLVGGWTLSGVFIYDSGRFLTPLWSGPDPTGTFYTDSATRPNVTIRPDQVGDPNLPSDQRSTSQWFNVGAFKAPQPGHFGNAKKGTIKGPSQEVVNAGLQKAFVVSENWPRFVFEMSARNVLNHANYSLNPWEMDISNVGSVGRITWAGGIGDESANPRSVRFGFRVEW